MARELFVYWKVRRDQHQAAQAVAAALLQTLSEAQPALQMRLMRRAEETGDQLTFMETYSAPGGVTAALQAAIETQAHLAFATLGHPRRHAEVFESIER